MHLFSPQRPFLPDGSPAWIRGDIKIAPLELFPLKNKWTELSIMLPIKESRFKSKRFSMEIDPMDMYFILNDFISDPEAFCELHFTSDIESFQPELRAEAKSNPKKEKIKTPSISDEMINI